MAFLVIFAENANVKLRKQNSWIRGVTSIPNTGVSNTVNSDEMLHDTAKENETEESND